MHAGFIAKSDRLPYRYAPVFLFSNIPGEAPVSISHVILLRGTELMEDVPHGAPADAERRRHARRQLDQSGRMLDHDAAPIDITIVDISIGGLGILVSDARRKGDPCVISFNILIENRMRRINAWAKVVHCIQQGENSYRAGIRFCDHDPNSKSHIEELCAPGGARTGWR